MQEQVCKNCGNHFTGKFCNNCGEKVYTDKDKKISHLFEEAFHFVTHFEGTFFTSLKTIITKPGQLSLDYCNGVRKKYFKPLSLFLLLVVLYLLFPIFEGLNMKLVYHGQNDLYGAFAQKKMESVMAAKQLNMKELSEMFHHKGEKVSKFLLFIILPFMAFISWRLGNRQRKFYYDHFIFATENSSFLLLWGFLLLPLILVVISVAFSKGLGIGDIITGPLILAGMLIHCIIAAKRFFRFSLAFSIFYSVIYILMLMAFIQYIYKFLLFFFSIIQI